MLSSKGLLLLITKKAFYLGENWDSGRGVLVGEGLSKYKALSVCEVYGGCDFVDYAYWATDLAQANYIMEL
jgi:hypothetical protein